MLDIKWWTNLAAVLELCKPYIRVGWLKTVIGGWTTSFRMHEPHKLPCFFGCCDENDCMLHYLCCPVLWQIVCSHVDGEDSILTGERVCFQNPTVRKLQRLALCHAVYHQCENDRESVCFGTVASPMIVQRRAAEFARELRYHCADLSSSQVCSSTGYLLAGMYRIGVDASDA